jgi:hypothetical protein
MRTAQLADHRLNPGIQLAETTMAETTMVAGAASTITLRSGLSNSACYGPAAADPAPEPSFQTIRGKGCAGIANFDGNKSWKLQVLRDV